MIVRPSTLPMPPAQEVIVRASLTYLFWPRGYFFISVFLASVCLHLNVDYLSVGYLMMPRLQDTCQ